MPCSSDAPRRRTTLAQRGAFRVDQCPCGTLHVTLGVLTVRLDARLHRARVHHARSNGTPARAGRRRGRLANDTLIRPLDGPLPSEEKP